MAKTLQIHIDNIIVHDEKHHNLGAAQQSIIVHLNNDIIATAAGVSVSVVRAEHADSPNEFTHWLVKSSLGFAQCVEPQLSGSIAALHAGGPEFVLFDMEQ